MHIASIDFEILIILIVVSRKQRCPVFPARLRSEMRHSQSFASASQIRKLWSRCSESQFLSLLKQLTQISSSLFSSENGARLSVLQFWESRLLASVEARLVLLVSMKASCLRTFLTLRPYIRLQRLYAAACSAELFGHSLGIATLRSAGLPKTFTVSLLDWIRTVSISVFVGQADLSLGTVVHTLFCTCD